MAARVLWNRPWSVADRPPGGHGPSGPWQSITVPFLFIVVIGINYLSMDVCHNCCSGFGGLRKKLAGRFKSKRPRGNDPLFLF